MLYVDEGAVPPAGAGSAANGDAFGAFQKLEKEDREDVEEEEEEEDDFRVVVRSGPGARSLRTDKDATEMDTSDDEDDRGAAHSPLETRAEHHTVCRGRWRRDGGWRRRLGDAQQGGNRRRSQARLFGARVEARTGPGQIGAWRARGR